MWWFIIGGILLILTIHDIWTGEYSMIRFYLEVIIVYGSVLLGGIVWFAYDNNTFGPIAFFIGLGVGLGYRQEIITMIEKLLPPRYDKMDVDAAIVFLKKRKIKLSSLITYLDERRNLSDQTILEYLRKHYSEEELREVTGKYR